MEFEDLIQRAKAGESAAVEELFRRFSPAVLARLRGQLRPGLRKRYDTEDLGQSVFAEVLRDLPGLKSDHEGSFRKWLWLKTQSKLWGKLRRHLDGEGQRRELTWDGREPEIDSDPSDHAEAREDRVRLDAALQELDEIDRQILDLRDRGEFAYSDIAEQLGLASGDAARMRYARAVLKLRERWKTL